MKRDMDLIREILLHIEETNKLPVMNKSNVMQVCYHLGLLQDGGFISGLIPVDSLDSGFREYSAGYALTITWNGHEFLDSIKDDGIWNQTKESIANSVGTVSVSVMIMLAKEYAMRKLNLK